MPGIIDGKKQGAGIRHRDDKDKLTLFGPEGWKCGDESLNYHYGTH